MAEGRWETVSVRPTTGAQVESGGGCRVATQEESSYAYDSFRLDRIGAT